MNPTAATPIHLMTEDQAAAELARILDTQPDDSNFLALLSWEQMYRQVIVQLQAHIAHLRHVAAHQDEAPAAAPTPTHQETPMESHRSLPPVNTRTSDEKMATAVAHFEGLLARVQARPADRALRNNASKAAAAVRVLAKRLNVTAPELRALPELPDTKYQGPVRPAREMPAAVKGRAAVLHQVVAEPALPDPARGILTTTRQRQVDEENEERQGTIQQLLDVQEPGLESPALLKAGPGPYVPPTSNDILAELAQRQHHQVPEPAQADLYARSEIADGLDFCPLPPPTAQVLARAIQRSLWPLIDALDALDAEDRAPFRPALDEIHARLQIAYALVDEGSIAVAI